MANEQYAFISKSKVPTLSQWQKAINDSGFDLKIDETLVIFEHSGFLPCKLAEIDSGVEVYYSPIEKLFDDPSIAEELADGRDYCISFRWGGDFYEGASAMIPSYALAANFDSIVSYEGESSYDTLELLRKEAEGMLAEAKKQKRKK